MSGEGDWILEREAIEHGARFGESPRRAAERILAGLQDGAISARARFLRRTRMRVTVARSSWMDNGPSTRAPKTEEFRNKPLPPWYWDRATIKVGDDGIVSIVPQRPSISARGIMLLRDDVLKLWPKPAAGGRPPKYDWEAFHIEVMRIIHTEGLPEKRAALEKRMMAWCEQHWNEDIGESTVRERVSRIYRELGRKPET